MPDKRVDKVKGIAHIPQVAEYFVQHLGKSEFRFVKCKTHCDTHTCECHPGNSCNKVNGIAANRVVYECQHARGYQCYVHYFRYRHMLENVSGKVSSQEENHLV